ncbi:hypothetical protein HL669_21885 (plasmid) [Vibrio parahaemolyticus]|uniref:hypothetical protein n=1 Tax=Vibrio parahaemolyticus TaxID=670 RepID=UPI0014854DC2|nr:hypothetical protein [Vibrio parahaemolyticus]NNU14265.1 hypothetical protein [Vibrio parahaemolyticus]
MPKPRYKTTNWKLYNQALINRGSLTFGLMKRLTKGTIQHLTIDATGLKIYGDGAYDTRLCYWQVK